MQSIIKSVVYWVVVPKAVSLECQGVDENYSPTALLVHSMLWPLTAMIDDSQRS